VLIFSSCGIFKDKRTKKRPTSYKKENPVIKKDPVRVDTILWEEDIVEIPEIREEDLYKKYGSEFLDIYRVSVILPLETSSLVEDLSTLKSDLSFRFINYYAGIQLALEDLSKKGLSLEVKVHNSSLKSNDGRQFMYELNKFDPHLIIGPYERDLLKEIAAYGKRKMIPVISPWQSSSKIAAKNPYYIQLKPDIKTYYKTMVSSLDKRYIPEQVYLVARENNRSEITRINYLQEVHRSATPSGDGFAEYNNFLVEEDSLSLGVTAFDSLFVDQFYREIAVVIPNWSYRDEQFIYSCLRKLNAEKQEIRVNVYGMPIMLESDKIGYNLFKSLNMKVVLQGYVDKNDLRVQQFKNRFYETFSALPVNDAFEGYDVMNYIGNNLLVHGTRFQYFLPGSLQQFVQTSFEISPKLLDETILLEDLDDVDYFENSHLDVWEFQYNGFVKLN
jgi:hypothetical protein